MSRLWNVKLGFGKKSLILYSKFVLMIYVFEGARNSGKSFLSQKISEQFSIPRFQFDFVGSFSLLKLDSKTRESHSFAMGKELMLMQLSKDLEKKFPNLIHDRGIFSVLTWGILEGRILETEAHNQLQWIKRKSLLSNFKFVYIEGENPYKEPRYKDRWDFADTLTSESEIFSKFFDSFLEPSSFIRFHNNFDDDSVDNLINRFQKFK